MPLSYLLWQRTQVKKKSLLYCPLALGIATAIDFHSFDRVGGPPDVVRIFIGYWARGIGQCGLAIKPPSASSIDARISYATMATFAHLLRISSEANDGGRQRRALGRRQPDLTAFDDVRRGMDIWVQMVGLVCRIDGDIEGYVATDRETKRTIAIRNVFVSLNHRSNVAAEAITRAVTRFMLGAERLARL
ncbi:hypothetical protein PHLGIDRAFT_13701 [Phlebiopsis gigantea 11061_1 CR5-6]|uniref:Uncharacterized protein n=1 Tax=Phlebiopsis gigantea (strain 11061_1 CR5-6) TaxID=745531 RepID=A0A0C3RXN2_PHLG1|nr:hypothetical protein PHLGIDRAFT_13701 [Phlebiopsis gigantea 11061_1 CR5-6]